MSGAMNRHCIPGLTMSTAWRGTSLRECQEPVKRYWGLKRVHVLHYVTPGADTEETGRYDSRGKICVSVLNALSK